MLFLLLVAALALAGCKKKTDDSDNANVPATNHKIEVDSEGSIVETLVEKFDKEYYSKAELTTFVDGLISDHNKTAGGDKVTLNSIEEKDNEVTLELKYSTAIDYTEFNNVILFVGSISDAISAGYEFEIDFSKISKGKVDTEDVKADEIKALGDDYTVIVTNQAGEAAVPSNISYISQNVVIKNKQAAVIVEENGAVDGTETTETAQIANTAQATDTTETSIMAKETNESDGIKEQQNIIETNENFAYIIYKNK